MSIKRNNVMMILVALGMLSGLSGCKYYHSNFNWGLAATNMNMKDPPPGPPEYQQGWKDGCESGYKAYGDFFPKIFFKWKQDPYLAQKEVYYKAWKDAYAHCANHANMQTLHGLGNVR